MKNNAAQIYDRFAKQCASRNQLRRFQITLENRMTPQNAFALLKKIPSNAPQASITLDQTNAALRQHYLRAGRVPPQEDFQNWMFEVDSAAWKQRLAGMLALTGTRTPKAFIEERLAPTVALYTTPGQKQDKTLIMGFTGNTGRLMLPTSVFLQSLPTSAVDVALFWDPDRESFTRGLKELGDNIGGMISEAARRLEVDRYPKVVTIGTSSGGMCAILAALALKLDSNLSIGAVAGSDHLKFAEAGVPAMIEEYTAKASRIPPINLAFSEGHDRDTASATYIARRVPANLWPISMPPTVPPQHNALYPLLVRGELTKFLGSKLLNVTSG